MFKLIVAGGGSASVTVVGHLIRSGRYQPKDILVVEPSPENYYQPGFTMIGGGLLGDNQTFISKKIHLITAQTSKMFNKKVNILPKEVIRFDPENNSITVNGGESYQYENLIVALGIKLDYESIPGLLPALNSENSRVCSIYKYHYALKTNKVIGEFQGGKAVFCMPGQPVKCGGAPQKILNLSYDRFTQNRIKFNSEYYFPQPSIFGIPKYAEKLKEIALNKGISLFPGHMITRVEDEKNLAYFKNDKEEVSVKYDMLHVVPPHKPVDVLKKSSIVDSTGFVDLNKETMRHNKYKNIWGLGDCTNLPTSKTLAAAISQSSVLTDNLIQALDNKETTSKYHGYTSCPIFVGSGKLMLCEFKYNSELNETFAKNQEVPRRLFYWIKRYFFPRCYFNLIPRGLWYGPTNFFKPKNV